MTAVVGRLAPSPTGRLHLGHARTFLITWWSARAQGGDVVMRVEDLDETRVKAGATERVLRDLEWLGLEFVGEVMFQSSQREAHGAALSELVHRGLAYPCVCTRREIERAASAPHVSDDEQRYPGTCRDRFASVRAARDESGRDVALRLRVSPGLVTIEDRLHGEVAIDVEGTVGDFVIGRKDGAAAYQFATPFDDAAQGVTEVVRGDDLLSSAARQKLVLEAIGLEMPRQLHVPLVHDCRDHRLAKRAESLSLEELRAAGISSEMITAWAASTLGLAPTGGGADSYVDGFNPGRIGRAPVGLPQYPVAALRSFE